MHRKPVGVKFSNRSVPKSIWAQVSKLSVQDFKVFCTGVHLQCKSGDGFDRFCVRPVKRPDIDEWPLPVLIALELEGDKGPGRIKIYLAKDDPTLQTVRPDISFRPRYQIIKLLDSAALPPPQQHMASYGGDGGWESKLPPLAISSSPPQMSPQLSTGHCLAVQWHLEERPDRWYQVITVRAIPPVLGAWELRRLICRDLLFPTVQVVGMRVREEYRSIAEPEVLKLTVDDVDDEDDLGIHPVLGVTGTRVLWRLVPTFPCWYVSRSRRFTLMM